METNTNKIILVCLCLGLFILYGCDGFSFNSGAEFNPDVHKGSEGLRIEIQQNTPPDEVYEKEKFKVVANVINKGAYEASNAIVSVNYESDFVDLLSERKVNVDLKGKDVYNMWNDEKIISFDMQAGILDKKSELHTSFIMLTTCYDYETIASFQVCIDTNIYQTRPESDKVCTVSDQSSSGQGGPLIVSKVEEDISGGEYVTPSFKIYIQNRGRGNIIREGKKEEACTSVGITEDDYDIVILADVELSTYKLSNGDIRCSPDELKLRDDELMIRCTLERNDIRSSDPSFMTSLKIHLKYGYTETESVVFDIMDDFNVEGKDSSIKSGDSGEVGESTDCASNGCCESDKGGVCRDPCNSNTCSGVCMSGYCAGGTSRVCCVPFRGAGGSW